MLPGTRRPSALSDLIRQATASEVSDNSTQVENSVIHSTGRNAQRAPSSGPTTATAEELAEAFFPGSSIREHAFFPKSLTTHSQLSHSNTHYGFLGGFRPGQWAPSDAAQTSGTSPPFGYGSLRASSIAAGGAAGSAATTHSFQRQTSTHVSIAEADGEGEGQPGDTAHSHSLQGSGPPLASSWLGWRMHHSPLAGGDGGTHGQGGRAGAPHRQPSLPGGPYAHSLQPQHPHPTQGGLQQQQQQSAFSLQPQLGRRSSFQRDTHHRGQQHQQHPQQQQRQQRHPAEGVEAGWQAGDELTEPLLSEADGLAHPDLEAATSGAEVGPGANGGMVGQGPAGTSPAHADSATAAAAVGAAAVAAAAAAASQPAVSELPPELRRRSSFFNAMVFGVINAVVSMPTLIAYAAIVFKAPLYNKYLDSLCRFFFFSSAIHQLVFVALSTLPFAIGQVQDVGLIFLSAMASDIALRVTGEDAAEVALGSSLLVMTISTFVVGLLTVVVARLKLADMVSYVPLPVVGGYLGFVGYFCIAGGTALAAGKQVDTLISWARLFDVDPAIKLVPTAATIAVLMWCVEHVSHPLALPGLLTAIPLLFHGVLWARGWDLEQAQKAGWVMKPTEGISNFWQLWGLFNLQNGGLAHGVSVAAMVAQLPKLAGLFLVVCFGSCMDVAAIQSDMPTPLDFNRELLTVGVSNMVTGAMGAGYTGSYIFSQTVFTMRQGVFNRVNGLAVAIVELLVFALPFSVVQYMPNFFFGALLVWFGIEISRDWLILSYKKLSRSEYVLLWATFVAIMNAGLELGIAAGVVMATLYFAYQYAQSQVSSLRQVAARSGRTHVYDTSSALDLLGRRMAVLRLGGYVFFGSSTGLSNQVLQLAARMLQERAEEQRQHEEWALSVEQRDGREGEYGSRTDLAAAAMAVVSASAPAVVLSGPPAPPPGVDAATAADAAGGGGGAVQAAAAQGKDDVRQEPVAALVRGLGAEGEGGLTQAERHWREAQAVAMAPVVLILDFGAVTGLDSTAARTFATLVITLSSQRVNVIFANLRRPDSRKLLEANGLPLRPFVIPPAPGSGAATASGGGGGGSRHGSEAGAGGGRGGGNGAEAGGGAGSGGGAAKGAIQSSVVSHPSGHLPVVAESPLLRPSAGGCWEFSTVASAVRCCEDAYLGLAMSVGLIPAAPSQAASLQQLLSRNLREVFPSTPSDLGGLVGALEGALTRKQLQLGDLLYNAGSAVREVYVIEFGALVEEEHYEGGVRVGSREHGAGVVVGTLEFFLSRPATATVRCSSSACQLLCISRAAYGTLMAHHPRALAALQVLLMRSACMDLASAQDAANHGAAP